MSKVLVFEIFTSVVVVSFLISLLPQANSHTPVARM